ncbi:MAG: hypothetical protein LQ350_008378 [Teloschistes chrysophthalmus]|nr:MAG: hypothetical protein LQ350_008378 [Niorma chrysophthalma]
MDPLLGPSQQQDGRLSGDGNKELPPKANGLRGFIRRFQGWRMGVRLCAIAALLVLTINVLFTVAVTARYGSHSGLVTFSEGNCTKVENLSIWLHLLLNIFGTVILAASNYCMQCLSSPTRADIDKAHMRHRWLDIGIPSFRNLLAVSRRRVLLWSLLALSSVPLHLLYNSVIIPSKSTQEYSAYVASTDLLTGNGINWTAPVGRFHKYGYSIKGASLISYDRPNLNRFRNISSTWKKLDNDDCIKTYAQTYIQGHGDVVMITPALNSSVPMLSVTSVGIFSTAGNSGWDWMCSHYRALECTQEDLRETPSRWTLNDTLYLSSTFLYSEEYPVQYCLSEPVQERCAMQLSVIIMIVVILCNAVKVLCMFLTLWHQRSAPLVTIGDAIQSFLQEPDLTTKDMCWADKNSFPTRNWKGSAKPWQSQKHLWFASASTKRWLACNLLSIATIIAAGILFRLGLTEVQMLDNGTLRGSGFGEINTQEMANWSLSGTSGLLGTILIANSPQLLLSFLFLAYNALLTCMLLAEESNDFAHERKPLRVSTPVGNQRSTYRLQLPYKYGIPLLIALALLHWLISQSLFLARVNVYTSRGRQDTGESVSTIGYSVLPLAIVLAIASAIVLSAILMGFRRLKPGLPLVGSNSAAISAACHAPMEDSAVSEKSLMWGAVGEKIEDGVGHCSFTSFEITLPVDGEMYAGCIR